MSSEVCFYPNLAFMKLIESQASEVNRSERVDCLKTKLANIQKMSEDFKLNLEKGTFDVTEHCVQLRNQVHLQTDILLEQVHKFNETLINEINEYENQCIESYDNRIVEKAAEFNQQLLEIQKFCDESYLYLNEFMIDYNKIDGSLKKADECMKRLKEVNVSLKRLKFLTINSSS